MTHPRFALEWVLPLSPELMTHVTLFDEERKAPYPLAVGVVAVGHGADEIDALLDLWTRHLAAVAESAALRHDGDAATAIMQSRPGVLMHDGPNGVPIAEHLPSWPIEKLETFRAGLLSFFRAVAEHGESGGQIPIRQVGPIRFGAMMTPRKGITLSRRHPEGERHEMSTRAASVRNATLTIDGAPDDVLWFQILMLLRDAGVGRLLICPQCRRLFAKVGKQDYCTKRCQNTHNKRAARRQKAERERRLSLSPRLSPSARKRT